jgi:hypothetical protein
MKYNVYVIHSGAAYFTPQHKAGFAEWPDAHRYAESQRTDAETDQIFIVTEGELKEANRGKKEVEAGPSL